MPRDTQAPLTSLQITDVWLKDQSLRTDDQTRVVVRKRISAVLIALRATGLARNEGLCDCLKGWRLAGR